MPLQLALVELAETLSGVRHWLSTFMGVLKEKKIWLMYGCVSEQFVTRYGNTSEGLFAKKYYYVHCIMQWVALHHIRLSNYFKGISILFIAYLHYTHLCSDAVCYYAVSSTYITHICLVSVTVDPRCILCTRVILPCTHTLTPTILCPQFYGRCCCHCSATAGHSSVPTRHSPPTQACSAQQATSRHTSGHNRQLNRDHPMISPMYVIWFI